MQQNIQFSRCGISQPFILHLHPFNMHTNRLSYYPVCGYFFFRLSINGFRIKWSLPMSPCRLSSTSPRFSAIALSKHSAKLNHRSNPSLSGNSSGRTNESSAHSSPSELDKGVPVTMSRACTATASRQRLSTHLSFLRRCPSSTTMYFHWEIRKKHSDMKFTKAK